MHWMFQTMAKDYYVYALGVPNHGPSILCSLHWMFLTMAQDYYVYALGVPNHGPVLVCSVLCTGCS